MVVCRAARQLFTLLLFDTGIAVFLCSRHFQRYSAAKKRHVAPYPFPHSFCFDYPLSVNKLCIQTGCRRKGIGRLPRLCRLRFRIPLPAVLQSAGASGYCTVVSEGFPGYCQKIPHTT